jgi:hypothetical protein
MAVDHHNWANPHLAPVSKSRGLSHAPAVEVSAIFAAEVLNRRFGAGDDDARMTS